MFQFARKLFSEKGLQLRTLALVANLAVVRLALAADTAKLPGIDVKDVSGLRTSVLCVVASAMFWILLSLSVVFAIVAAYKYLTSGGDTEKVSGATKTLTYAAVAVAVALLAKAIPLVIANLFNVSGISGC